MPIKQRPSGTVEVTLQCEAHKPEADRILWTCRALSCAEVIDYEERREAAYKTPGHADSLAAFHALILSIATGWGNLTDEEGQPIPFGVTSLSRYFRPSEIRQIAADLPWAISLTHDEKKSSPSPS